MRVLLLLSMALSSARVFFLNSVSSISSAFFKSTAINTDESNSCEVAALQMCMHTYAYGSGKEQLMYMIQ
jgi:hypothetical protein